MASPIDKYVNVKYKLRSSKHFEEYLKVIGVGLISRKAACAVSPIAVLTKEGDTYTFTMTTTFRTITFSFKFDEEFIEERPDGVKLKSVMVLDGDIMTQTQTEDNGRKSTHVRTFSPDLLTVLLKTVKENIVRKQAFPRTKNTKTCDIYQPPPFTDRMSVSQQCVPTTGTQVTTADGWDGECIRIYEVVKD